MIAKIGIRKVVASIFCTTLIFWIVGRPITAQDEDTPGGPPSTTATSVPPAARVRPARSKPKRPAAPCVDYTDDPAGCQPSTFEVPWTEVPSRRVGRDGHVNPKSSEADARAGAALVERKYHLFRNFTQIHWVLTVPSIKDPATGDWKGGDLDAEGDGRGLGIAGSCIYTGHGNGAGKKRAINIFRIQPDPVKNPPVQVGEIPAMFEGNQGFDDRELRSLVYTTSKGEERQIMVRNGGTQSIGREMVYDIDPKTCLVKSVSDVVNFGGQSHEFFLWHDPANPNRVLIYVTIWTAGIPDVNAPGLVLPDLFVLAVTDEDTGEVLQHTRILGTFTLEDAGGPPYNEKPDATGLFSDGRFIHYAADAKDLRGRPANSVKIEWNKLHSISVSDDGERAYVAGTTAGFYILNTEAIAHHKDVDLAGGNAGCNLHTTIAAKNGVIDAAKLPDLANDCVHMVINDDPGVKAYLASDAPPEAKIERYLALENRSRYDVYPPFVSQTSTHSAVIVPDRPAEVVGNTKGRPAYVWLTDETLGGCPLQFARIVSIESEITPAMVGAFGIPDDLIDNCLNEPITEPDSTMLRRPIGQQNHNPTVFKNLVFNGWYGHGLRAIDISIPMTPREVGYAIAVPQGLVRTYPIFKDGLIYYNDNRTGLHVLKYTGPRADELPGPGSGVTEGNATSPHK